MATTDTTTTTRWITGTDGREYEIDEATGRVVSMERVDSYEDYDDEGEMFAEFVMSWVTGGGNASDASAAWAQGIRC